MKPHAITIKWHLYCAQPWQFHWNCLQSTIGGDINSIHHLASKKGWSSLKDAFLKYYSLKTGNKNNNKAATLPSAISSICCRCGQTRLMNDDKSYSKGGSWPAPCYSFVTHLVILRQSARYIDVLPSVGNITSPLWDGNVMREYFIDELRWVI